MTTTISYSHQLPMLLNRNKKIDFVFEFPALNTADNLYWAQKIRHNYFACGCNTGKIFMKYTLLATLACICVFYFFYRDIFSVAIGVYAVIFVFIMAGLGKAVGKLSAYNNLKKDIRKLYSLTGLV